MRITKIRILFPLLVLMFLLFISQTYRLKSRKDIPPAVVQTLYTLANKALETKDIPIAAVLMYQDSIVGMGYNTVVRDTLISGHAELNALNDAHRKNRERWARLERSRMILYSTYEPCDMCKGALINMQIGYTVFEGPKTMAEQIKSTLKSWWYELKKRRFDKPGMQQQLFLQHPDYQFN